MKLLKECFLGLSFFTSILQPSLAIADSDPSHQPEQERYQIKRTADTPQSVQFSLTKDVFRQEPYQAEYVVQIPYQETETYTEQVPYSDTEAYEDLETYYDSEYQCRYETSYRQECRTETICNFDGGRPGRYPDDGGGRPGRYPDNGGGGYGGGSSCRNHQVCESVPYSDRVCGYVNVPRTRYVTKYRTVTRYRSEQRTRTVTRYRNETRCCQTRYRDVFDHQYSLSVTVKLPEVTLAAGETENLYFELSGDEKNPSIEFRVGDAIYSYQISKKEITGANAFIELVTVPKFDRSNAGPDSVGGFVIEKQGATSVLKFADQVIDGHVKTTYSAKVKDVNGALLAERVSVSRNSKQIFVKLDHDLTNKGPAVVEVNIRRESPLVKDNILTFTVFKGLVLK